MPQAERSSGMLVIQPIRDWTCSECAGTGDLLRMEDAGPLRLTCSDLEHLVFLPSGDAALTRRATKASSNACRTLTHGCAAENATSFAGSTSMRTSGQLGERDRPDVPGLPARARRRYRSA